MDQPTRRSGWMQTPRASWSQHREHTRRTTPLSADRSSVSSTRVPISGPFGPVTRNGQPLSSNLERRSSISKPSNSHSRIPPLTSNISYRNDENLRPVKRGGSNAETSHGKRGVTKSRTLGVFSSFTHSLSRGSLVGNNSRNVSGSSVQSKPVSPAPQSSRKSENRLAMCSLEPLTTKSHTGNETASVIESPPLPSNSRFVSQAMPPQYWAGRFMSLHDKFHNELLTSHNLGVIIEAQTPRKTYRSESTALAAAQNNPSASAYSVRRFAPIASLNQFDPHSESQNSGIARPPTRIPHSATSGAILQTTPFSMGVRNSPMTGSRAYKSYSKPFSRSPSYDPTILETKAYLEEKSVEIPTQNVSKQRHVGSQFQKDIHHNSGSSARRQLAVTNGVPLDDDDARCRRVFIHLEALCVTEEARASLYSWRILYARNTGKTSLLPRDETMTGGEVDRHEFSSAFEKGKGIVRRLRKSLMLVHGPHISSSSACPRASLAIPSLPPPPSALVQGNRGHGHGHAGMYGHHAEFETHVEEVPFDEETTSTSHLVLRRKSSMKLGGL
ncbi:hypothetical protein QBC35DRAFT_387420 [Podospora australis]|uniref:Uncharacterized protein n=1 Tax=Podospora australis TaxID=1536484 RepID=A0AAN7AGI5_9PEZI|nr:hypothetical protein QBC35DRAFT_387420 [Podospora australis]